MLSRLILLGVQLAVAWYGADQIVPHLPRFGAFQLLVYAAVFAVLVWLVGLVLSQILRETGMPSSSTLAASLVVALIFAAFVLWVPDIVPEVGRMLPRIDERLYPLIGAVIGYHLKR
jgi:hypothetical protein